MRNDMLKPSERHGIKDQLKSRLCNEWRHRKDTAETSDKTEENTTESDSNGTGNSSSNGTGNDINSEITEVKKCRRNVRHFKPCAELCSRHK